MKPLTSLCLFTALLSSHAFAQTDCQTQRKQFFDKSDAKSWQTTLCRNTNLPFHKHTTSRIIIPDRDGQIKVKYKDGNSLIVNLKKGIPVYLPKSEGLKLHQDINISDSDIRLMVVEIK